MFAYSTSSTACYAVRFGHLTTQILECRPTDPELMQVRCMWLSLDVGSVFWSRCSTSCRARIPEQLVCLVHDQYYNLCLIKAAFTSTLQAELCTKATLQQLGNKSETRYALHDPVQGKQSKMLLTRTVSGWMLAHDHGCEFTTQLGLLQFTPL